MACILIVDDEPDVRATLCGMLERRGHWVIEATDGTGALKRFAEHQPDLMIIDLMMPVREGIETIRELRARGVKTPIIAMSGGGRVGSNLVLRAASMLGADRELEKPIRVAELLAAVEGCLTPAAA
jgi:DNA-binding response OmpR family regulator